MACIVSSEKTQTCTFGGSLGPKNERSATAWVMTPNRSDDDDGECMRTTPCLCQLHLIVCSAFCASRSFFAVCSIGGGLAKYCQQQQANPWTHDCSDTLKCMQANAAWKACRFVCRGGHEFFRDPASAPAQALVAQKTKLFNALT